MIAKEKEASKTEEVVEAALNKVREGGQSFEVECFDSRLVEGLENLSLWRGQLLP